MDADIAPEDRLAGGEILADGELIAPATRGEDELRAAVRIGRPLTYPVRAAELPLPLRRRAETSGVRYAGVLFAFDLGDPPEGRPYSSVRFTVQLDGFAVAARVHVDGGQFGVEPGPEPRPASPVAVLAHEATGRRPGLLRRLGSRADRPRASGWGVQSSLFGWTWTGGALPSTYGVHALVELTGGVEELAGRLVVDADVAGPVRRRVSLSEAVPFREQVPAGGRAEPAAVPLYLAVDGSRIRHDLVALLAAARRAAGIEPTNAAGDGRFTVLPAGIEESVVIPRLISGIADGLARANRGRAERERLRIALHRDATAVHRLLDSPALRRAADEHPDAPFVLAVPEVLFLDVIVYATEPPPATAFTAMTVDLPATGFREHGWIHVPEASA